MLKGQDMLVLAALAGRREPPPTLSTIADETGLAVSAVHRSVAALRDAQLIDESRAPQRAQIDEFAAHALRYLFPPRMGGETRGVPTAWAAEPLRDQLASSGDAPLVWPDPHGQARGIALEPLHPAVPDAARRNPALGQRLALLDALRLSDARVRGLAREELRDAFNARTEPT